jgi:sodium-dependent phosphate cotransporter
VAVAAPQADAAGAGGIQLPVWTKVLGWCGTAGLIYLLICAVSIISRGFAGLGGDAAQSMFAFAANPWVGLSVGVLGTILIQSSTTTTAIAVTAVGSGALPIRGAIPIILGANVGTTVTTTWSRSPSSAAAQNFAGRWAPQQSTISIIGSRC